MATFGSVTTYDTKTDWSSYKERLDYYFDANNITLAKKKSVFLSAVGAETYDLVRTLLAPNLIADTSLADILKCLDTHFTPTPNIIVERFVFYDCAKTPSQSIKDYIAKLRELSRTCSFGTNADGSAQTAQQVLENNLRDKFVWEMRKESRIQQRLLAEKDLSFTKATNIALAMELARQGVQTVSGTDVKPEVYHIAKNIGSRSNLKKYNSNSGKNSYKHFSTNNASPKSNMGKPCWRCGQGGHTYNECRFKTAECLHCKKIGHIKANCFSLMKDNRTSQSHNVQRMDYELYAIREDSRRPLVADITVNGRTLAMEIDTGAAVSLMSRDNFQKFFKGQITPQLHNTKDILKTYTGEQINIDGTVYVQVSDSGNEIALPLMIVPGNGPTLLGRNWLHAVKIKWDINFCATVSVETILKKYPLVFADSNTPVKNIKASIYVKDNAIPAYFKARQTPYALLPKVDEEIDRLLKDDIIESVQNSEWAAPCVPVVKSDGSVRLCGDYKVTVNKYADIDGHPIPRINDLYAKLGGGKSFSRLDMKHAYEQLLLEPDSRKYVTINTHRGLFTYKRLPYGVSSAPSIFQRVMDSMFRGMANVLVYLDDILITGPTDEEHLRTLDAVLCKLAEGGWHLKDSKCEYLQSSVVFLGHTVDKEGIHPAGAALAAIRDARAPTNVTELRSFIGMVNHYARFIPGLSGKLTPLHELLHKDNAWSWTNKRQTTFNTIKTLLSSPKLIVHFDPDKPLVLTTDASDYGIGAVLSHAFDDGTEKPIACFSRTLSSAERNYAQLDKEGLAVIFGLKKCHQFVYGRHLTIITDHKPLITLLGEHKLVPQMVSPRIQRWALTLASYDYTIKFRPGRDIPEADALSRLPLDCIHEAAPTPGETVLFMECLNSTPVTASNIRQWTKRDIILSRVLHMVKSGQFTHNSDNNLKPYISRRNELSVQDDILLWGNRVIIPPQGRRALLEELHTTHSGIVRTKSLARSILWWPKMDEEIEQLIKQCDRCQTTRHTPAKAPLHPWVFTDGPWSRIHIDYAGPISGRMLLIIVDSHSKWIDVHTSVGNTSTTTIEHLRKTFSTHGLPDTLVSDNAACFTSAEFQTYCKMNAIHHVTSAPYHPASNGLAERAVQTVKEGLSRMTEGTLDTRLARFLFTYRITPQSTTNTSPAELLMKRHLKSRLDAIRPDLHRNVANKQNTQKEYHDRHSKQRDFNINDRVYIKIFQQNVYSWQPGTVVSSSGPVSYVVSLIDGRNIRCHVDQIIARSSHVEPPPNSQMDSGDTPPEPPSISVESPVLTPSTPVQLTCTPPTGPSVRTPVVHLPNPTPVDAITPSVPSPQPLRRSQRGTAGIPPAKLNL